MAKTWLPDLPPRALKRLSVFTVHRDGFIRRYKDAADPLFVLGRRKFLEAIEREGASGAVDLLEDAWTQRVERYEAQHKGDMLRLRALGTTEFVHLASEFFVHLDHRVEHGRPKRLAPVTRWDYVRTINELGVVIGPRKLVNDLGPDDFNRYALSIAKNAASSYGRKVAYVEAFLRWALQLGRFADNRVVASLTPGMDPLRALLGPQLHKPSKEDLRDERLQKEQSFTPAEIGKLWHVADDEDRLWIALGLNCAFDNGDIMGLTWRVVTTAGSYKGVAPGPAGLVIDYRRRKRGRIRRVVPLLPEVGCRLADQLVQRGDVEDDSPVFVEDGKSLIRLSESGPQNLVTRRFARLLVKAGLRKAPEVTRDPVTKRRRVLSAGSGDRRGYRSLRTTFSNLAPTGFRDEIEIVTGHAHGRVILDSYMETHGFIRLFELVSAVWRQAFSEPPDAGWRDQYAAASARSKDGESPALAGTGAVGAGGRETAARASSSPSAGA